MKKILTIAGVFLGILALSGCGSKPADTTSTSSTPPATQSAATAPDTTNGSNVPENSAADSLPVPTSTAPATASDVDSAVSSINADLDSADKNAPDTSSLESTGSSVTSSTAPTPVN